ncbi:Protein kinase-like domain containing protein [Tylopilus felleus]
MLEYYDDHLIQTSTSYAWPSLPLAQKRVYNDTDDVTARPDLQHARLYKTQFDYVFTASATPSPTVINDREFAAFHQLLRCFHKDVERIASNTSSSLKTSNFIVHFVQPPFFSEIDNRSRGFQYEQEKSWGFPIFVDSIKSPGVFRKFTPRSDWMVISPQFRIPFVISEVISDETENSRYRMLIEATVLARAGRFLFQCNSEKRFFVVAIYVNANMVASRYIVMDTGGGGPENEEASKPVSIHRQDFDLRQVDQEVDFLREMYNLATQMYAISDHLDQDKEKSLLELKDAAGDVLTLNSAEDQTRTIDSAITTSSTQGTAGSQGFQDEDDLGVFEAEDIQNVLHQMNYKIEFIPWGHPQLAAIVSKSDEMYGYLKFVESENELKVLRYLSEIKSPSNHTISGVQFWPVQGGAVISMPVAGGWLTSLDNPHEQLWSVALQLVEGVVFMHEHNVAHMNLKPQNVIIPPEGGYLSIIDFSVSIRVRSADARYSGVVGTEDYIAPEVRKGNYKPMLADLWSCGRTLEELCACCHSSPERTELLEIASRLMDRDPEARPKMSDVLEQMALTRRGKDRVVPPISATAPPASPSSLCVA